MKLKQIREAFDIVEGIFYNKNRNFADRLFEQCKAEEKQHRTGDFAKYHPNAASVADCARLFAVRRVVSYLVSRETMPSASEFNHVQTSCFIAAGIVGEFAADLEDAFLAKYGSETPQILAQLAALDYCEYVQVKGGNQ